MELIDLDATVDHELYSGVFLEDGSVDLYWADFEKNEIDGDIGLALSLTPEAVKKLYQVLHERFAAIAA